MSISIELGPEITEVYSANRYISLLARVLNSMMELFEPLSVAGGSMPGMDEDDELTMETAPVTADAALSDFFLLELARASGARLQRLQRATDDLRECFEAVADRILTTPELATRELERQFRPEGASARVADAFALLYVLPMWLEDARWHGDDLEDRRLRVQLTLPLARYVLRLSSVDGPGGGNCAFWDVEYAVQRARAEIRAAKTSERLDNNPPRSGTGDEHIHREHDERYPHDRETR